MNILRTRTCALTALLFAGTACILQLGCAQEGTSVSVYFKCLIGINNFLANSHMWLSLAKNNFRFRFTD